jgi:hypothetical protein
MIAQGSEGLKKKIPGRKLVGHDRRFWKDAEEYKPYLEQVKKTARIRRAVE